jgi:hypothetical protein
VATFDYVLTGELAWHLPGVPVVQLDERVRYDFAPPPDWAKLGSRALIVVRLDRMQPDLYARCFQHVERLADLTRAAGDAALRAYAVFAADRPVPDLAGGGCDRLRFPAAPP